MIRTVHEPRCNSACRPGSHYLSDGIGFPHIHRTDLTTECGECSAPPEPAPGPPEESP